jgi:hypothetical protein
MRLILSSVSGLVGFILLVVGCPLLAIAAGLFYFIDVGPSEWPLVPGEVTAIFEDETRDSDGSSSTVYCPTVAFTTLDGEPVTVDVSECSSPSFYHFGDPVEVYYDPAQSRNVQLKGGVRAVVGNIFVVVLGVIGGMLAFGGLAMLIIGTVVAAARKGSQPPPAASPYNPLD